VDETLKRALMRDFYKAKDPPGKFRKIDGADAFDKIIEIDQSPIGRIPRRTSASSRTSASFSQRPRRRERAATQRGASPST